MATTTQKQVQLIVERSGGELFGRTKVKGNLIVDSAKTSNALKKKMKQLILDFENIEVEEFEVSYDLTSFTEQYPYLNLSEVAVKAGISQQMMRQYTSGAKFPSEQRVKQIENAIHEIAKELSKLRLHKSLREYA